MSNQPVFIPSYSTVYDQHKAAAKLAKKQAKSQAKVEYEHKKLDAKKQKTEMKQQIRAQYQQQFQQSYSTPPQVRAATAEVALSRSATSSAPAQTPFVLPPGAIPPAAYINPSYKTHYELTKERAKLEKKQGKLEAKQAYKQQKFQAKTQKREAKQFVEQAKYQAYQQWYVTSGPGAVVPPPQGQFVLVSPPLSSESPLEKK